MRTRLGPNRWECSLAAGWWRPVSALLAVSRGWRVGVNRGEARGETRESGLGSDRAMTGLAARESTWPPAATLRLGEGEPDFRESGPL